MENKNLTTIFEYIKKKKYDAYYVSISNEHLYEFTESFENIVMKLTDFVGDTGSLLISKNVAYLYVDGRFVIEAKKEIKDKRIKVVKITSLADIAWHMSKKLKPLSKIAVCDRIESSYKILKMKEILDDNNIKIFPDGGSELRRLCKEKKLNVEIFKLDRKYQTKTPKTKIKFLCDQIKKSRCDSYITCNLEEIGYLTGLRRRMLNFGDSIKVLIDAFLIATTKKANLYVKEDLDDSLIGYLKKNDIIVKKYDEFYNDLTSIKNKRCYVDLKYVNFCVYMMLKKRNFLYESNSPLILPMSIKGKKEIEGLKKCNLIDGVAITKALYEIKDKVHSKKRITEYEAKVIVDDYRKTIAKDNFIAPSFSTIVAYKENAAICHYEPSISSSKKIMEDSILLIDSGGNYLFGSTDITRTISLYKKKAPDLIRKHYTHVLNSMIKLSTQKFPYGLTGTELDIIARQNLYNLYLNFEHGTGHGIGFVSNIHEGPNRIGPGRSLHDTINVIEESQVVSDEPGLYFENRYGIRIENDLLVEKCHENEYGSFLGFSHLTICPFDRDLIDEKYLDKSIIKDLNKYNAFVYKKLSKRLNAKERKRLKYDTKPFRTI
ncbi:MAG: M24 family metallopeptidase [Lachnospiraceae bacterium]|nr:M24 family metallopeptidase [Lachnospiraceae bacterium]